MLTATVLSLSLIFVTTAIHYLGLCWIACGIQKTKLSFFWTPPLIMFAITLLHLLEIGSYAVVYYVLFNYTELGGFTNQFDADIWSFLYFSGANYTTLGLSEFFPLGHFKVLSFAESLNGFLLLTWSATFFFSRVGQFSIETKDN